MTEFDQWQQTTRTRLDPRQMRVQLAAQNAAALLSSYAGTLPKPTPREAARVGLDFADELLTLASKEG